MPPLKLATDCGDTLVLAAERWFAPPSPAELDVLDRAAGPVLDVGCGPGRHVLALQRRGVDVTGVDVALGAVRHARRQGAAVLHQSVFDALPSGWRTILLLDGNVGIGGDPERLLGRASELLGPGGRILVETEPPGGVTGRFRARVELDGRTGRWFPWAQVAVDQLSDIASAVDLVARSTWTAEGRWFACLQPWATTPGCPSRQA